MERGKKKARFKTIYLYVTKHKSWFCRRLLYRKNKSDSENYLKVNPSGSNNWGRLFFYFSASFQRPQNFSHLGFFWKRKIQPVDK